MAPSVARVLNGSSACTGTVVGDRWVLTARHCTTRYSSTNANWWTGMGVEVFQGVRNASPRYFSNLAAEPLFLSAKKYASLTWSESTQVGTLDGQDVALLKLSQPMPSWVKTVPLAYSWPAVGTTLTAYGYGKTSRTSTQMSQYLMKTPNGDQKRVNCPTNAVPSVIAYRTMCAKGTVSNIWYGDSGGPLLWWNQGYWQQIGIANAIPAVSTDAPHYTLYWATVDSTTRRWVQNRVFPALANIPYGSILKDANSNARWMYMADGYRHWIPTDADYSCFQAQGAKVFQYTLRTVETVPDAVGSHATCTSAPPPPSTWWEQQGSRGANSFTNYHNASGIGPFVSAGQWVEVSCKVYDPYIASVNPDGYWYRIASSPWNNAYYAAANTFMNGDPWGGPYTHNTDFAVPDC